MKVYGIKAQELRDLVDAVALVEKEMGERLEPQDVGDVLGFLYSEGDNSPLGVAIARIALALGDDRPEFHAIAWRQSVEV